MRKVRGGEEREREMARREPQAGLSAECRSVRRRLRAAAHVADNSHSKDPDGKHMPKQGECQRCNSRASAYGRRQLKGRRQLHERGKRTMSLLYSSGFVRCSVTGSSARQMKSAITEKETNRKEKKHREKDRTNEGRPSPTLFLSSLCRIIVLLRLRTYLRSLRLP